MDNIGSSLFETIVKKDESDSSSESESDGDLQSELSNSINCGKEKLNLVENNEKSSDHTYSVKVKKNSWDKSMVPNDNSTRLSNELEIYEKVDNVTTEFDQKRLSSNLYSKDSDSERNNKNSEMDISVLDALYKGSESFFEETCEIDQDTTKLEKDKENTTEKDLESTRNLNYSMELIEKESNNEILIHEYQGYQEG
jgi:hypothetical protein